MTATALPIVVGAGAFASSAPAPHANTRAGDLLLLFVHSSNQDVTTPAGGWAEVADSPQGIGTGAAVGAVRLEVFWKRAAENEGAATVTNPGNHVFSQMLTIRGAIETGTPYDVTSGGTAASSTAVSITGDTTTLANTLVIAALAHGFDIGTDQVSAWANAALSGFAQVLQGASTTGTGGGINVAAGGKAAAGAYGASTATLANAAAQAFLTLAIKPAIGPWFMGNGANNGQATTMNVVWPAGHLAGDIGILVIDTENQTLAAPSGWAEFPSSPQGTGTAGTPGSTRLCAFWKRATSSAEADAAVADSGDHQVGAIYVFRNCVETGDPYDTTAGGTIASTTAYSATGVTTTLPNELVLALVSASTDISAGTPQLSAWANATLTDFGERFEASATAGSGGVYGLGSGSLAAPGASGTSTATLATASAMGWQTIALKPATGSAGGSPGGSGFYTFTITD